MRLYSADDLTIRTVLAGGAGLLFFTTATMAGNIIPLDGGSSFAVGPPIVFRLEGLTPSPSVSPYTLSLYAITDNTLGPSSRQRLRVVATCLVTIISDTLDSCTIQTQSSTGSAVVHFVNNDIVSGASYILSLMDVGFTAASVNSSIPFNITLGTTSSSTTLATVPSTSVPTAIPSIPASSSVSPAVSVTAVPAVVTDASPLSVGAKAGIGVGVGLAALIVLAGLIFFWRRRLKRKQRSSIIPAYAQAGAGSNSSRGDLHAEKEMKSTATPMTYQQVDNQRGIDSAILTTTTGAGPSKPTNAGVLAAGSAAVGGGAAAVHGSSGSGAGGLGRSLSSAGAADRRSWRSNDEALNFEQVPLQQQSEYAAPHRNALVEPGMSVDEMARLDEEERRIDEAIAEADRRRGRI